MQDCMNTVSDFGNVREAVCVSTKKIMDACRDQDCMEDLTVYLTRESQETLECATSVKARSAELLYAEDMPSMAFCKVMAPYVVPDCFRSHFSRIRPEPRKISSISAASPPVQKASMLQNAMSASDGEV